MADPDLFQLSGERVIKFQLVDANGLVIGNQGAVPGPRLWTDGQAVVQRIQLLDYLGNAILGIGEGTDLSHVYDEIQRVEVKVDQNESDIENKLAINQSEDDQDELNLANEIARSTAEDDLHNQQIAAINQFMADLPPFEDPPFITGDMFVFDGVKFNLLPVGTDGQNLGIIGGMPAWRDQAGPGVLPIWVSEFPPVDHGAYPLWWDSSDDIASGGRLKFYNTQAQQFVDATPSGIPGAQGLPGPQGIPGPQGPPYNPGYVPANKAGDNFTGPISVAGAITSTGKIIAGGPTPASDLTVLSGITAASGFAADNADILYLIVNGFKRMTMYGYGQAGILHAGANGWNVENKLSVVNATDGTSANLDQAISSITSRGIPRIQSYFGGLEVWNNTAKTFSIDGSGNVTAPNIPVYDTALFTPTLIFSSSSAGLTYNVRYGSYSRVGKQVTIAIDIEILSIGSAVGQVYLSGIPFIPDGGHPMALAITLIYGASIWGGTPSAYMTTSNNLILQNAAGLINQSNVNAGTRFMVNGTFILS